MGTFNLTGAVLRRLFDLNSFAIPSDRAVLFGLRGCLPLNEKEYGLHASRQLETAVPDHRYPRCVIGIWLPQTDQVAAYPGSTVPYYESVAAAIPADGEGCNQLVPSYLKLERGMHPRNPNKSQHEAFRQAMDFPVQRSGDDSVYELDDRWEVDSEMGDNMHCGESQGSHQAYFSSLGCQVLCGTAKRTKKPHTSDTGAWKAFRNTAYGDGAQKMFRYALLTGRQAQAAAVEPPGTLAKMVRYGSTGPLVGDVQDALSSAGYGTATQRGHFGRGTLLAVRRFQKDKGLPADAVVGPDTGSLLDLTDWPMG